MLEYSHPQGVGGSMVGSSRSTYLTDLNRIKCPVLAYWGSGDVEDNPQPGETCAVLGIEPVVLPGEHDHAEAFNDSATVVPIVLRFLEKV